jgi:hypothetical protein
LEQVKNPPAPSTTKRALEGSSWANMAPISNQAGKKPGTMRGIRLFQRAVSEFIGNRQCDRQRISKALPKSIM